MKLQIVSFSITSGGPEALHQLANAARRQGIDARIVYWPLGSRTVATTAYASYEVPVDLWIDDDAKVTVVMPETLPLLVHQVRHARVAIWWLSVDYYVHEWESRTLKQRVAEAVGLRPRCFDVRRPNPRILHLAQSEYARSFLEGHNKEHHAHMLTDYLSDDFLMSASEGMTHNARGMRVAFNPRKGYEQMKTIIASAQGGLDFVPLDGMTHAGVKAALSECAVYVDFGHHPGRDRIPREAAVCGCNVITGRRGAAGNPVDIPIDSRFKLDEAAPDFVKLAIDSIRYASLNYLSLRPLFDEYRRVINGQRAVFFEQVGQVLRVLGA